jgi:hypothetical protein
MAAAVASAEVRVPEDCTSGATIGARHVAVASIKSKPCDNNVKETRQHTTPPHHHTPPTGIPKNDGTCLKD